MEYYKNNGRKRHEVPAVSRYAIILFFKHHNTNDDGCIYRTTTFEAKIAPSELLHPLTVSGKFYRSVENGCVVALRNVASDSSDRCLTLRGLAHPRFSFFYGQISKGSQPIFALDMSAADGKDLCAYEGKAPTVIFA